MSRLFGTDGVRGIAGKELTVKLAMELGAAGALVLTKENAHKPIIVVGCDTRISGDMLANALMAGICAVGADAIYVGVVPTPAVAFLTRFYHADAGVVISASHNPAEFNGIKFFDQFGYKLPDFVEDEIEDMIASKFSEVEFASGDLVGRIDYQFEAIHEYVNFAKAAVPIKLDGMKIVIDCAEGASYLSSVEALKGLGADLIAIHINPDGKNINKCCGSTHMEELAARVVEEKADLGFAFDGDADRMLAVDEKGAFVDGDQLMAICGIHLKKKGLLKQNTIVGTVMSNLGFTLMGEEQEIIIQRTAVGDRYVLELMKEKGYNIGGEQSGHIIFLDENTTGDGLLSALHVLEVIVETGQKLSKLASVMTVLPQSLVNAKVSNEMKHNYMKNKEIDLAIKKLEEKFAGEGRVLIRPSGTEPLVRVMIEGKDQEEIEKEARCLADLIVKQSKSEEE